ncbi:MAG TPA: hypothetical protein DD473_06140 [Planctomycetaceae bacterium]|nr:hypothetical protein [Planctomycetaceae bacterium]
MTASCRFHRPSRSGWATRVFQAIPTLRAFRQLVQSVTRTFWERLVSELVSEGVQFGEPNGDQDRNPSLVSWRMKLTSEWGCMNEQETNVV